MKPTSIIFLILSAVLIAAGFGLCFTAKSISEDQNIELFTPVDKENDSTVETHEFTEYGISRIILKLNNVNVNIIGEAEKSYIELINFPKNTFDYTISAKTMTIDNKIGLFSIFNFTESGFEFNGLRHYLNFQKYSDKQKTVNIYIAPGESVKIFDIDIDSGDLKIEGLKKHTDYNVNIAKGNADIAYVTTSSALKLNIGVGDATIITNMILSCNVNLVDGDLKFYDNSYLTQSYNLNVPMGEVYILGVKKEDGYNVKIPIAATNLNADIASGNVYIDKIPIDRPYIAPTSELPETTQPQ